MFIFFNFESEYHICFKRDDFDYVINKSLDHQTLNNLNKWHLENLLFRKIILAKTRYKTHNNKLLAIVETFQT